MKTRQFQVIIVGGGPVGVGLAVDLGRRGIACVLVEKRPGMHNVPKGQNLTARTAEHFYNWGIIDELRAARIMPPEIQNNGVVAYKTLMSDYWFATKGREIVAPYYFQALERLPQYLMETVLRRKMASLAGVESRFGWSAGRIEQDAEGVRVEIKQDGGDGQEMLQADYVVGCDGGHSTVRQQIGIQRGGADFDQQMALMVFRSRRFHEGIARFPVRSTYRVMDPALNGYWQFFGRVDVGESFFFHSPVPAGTRTDNFDFHGLIQQVAGFEFPCTFDHVGFWDLRVAVADNYQVGRAFIAGDAAHSHPPYGGYGVNNGLEDAVNLGWKLAARLQGWGSDSLLASYTDERRAIFKETGDDFIAARIEHEAKFLRSYSPDKDRPAFERAWKDLEDDVGNRVSAYEPHYEGSPVVHGPPGGRSSAHGSFTFKARAGHHLPPRTLTSGRNVFEDLGSGFTLLAFGAAPQAVEAFEQAAKSLRVPLRVVRDTFDGGREDYGGRLVLVRPDQHIAWVGDAAPTDAGAVLGKAVGRGSSAD